MKILLIILASLLLASCIGDAVLTVKYSVKNKTDRTLTVKSKTNSSFSNVGKDSLISISPRSEKAVYVSSFICSFSDCRYKIKNDSFLDSVKYYFDIPNQYHKLTIDNWKIKKHSAKATIKN